MDFGRIASGIGTWGLSEAVPVLSGSAAKKKAQEEYQAQAQAERKRKLNNQLNTLGSMQAPQLSPLASKRIAALEAESAPKALAEDPLYAGQRAAVLGAGQQLQSGVENEQLGRNVRGGFANIGSTADIQDRLGVQLAQLGSQAKATQEKKRDMAAQAQQAAQDAQVEFQNAQARARMAIEAGDSDLALSFITQAMQAKQAAAEAERQMYAGIIGTAGTIAGGMMGGPAGAAAGSQAGNVATGGGGNQYSLGANTDYGQPADFGVGDTGAQYSNTTYANARRRGLY